MRIAMVSTPFVSVPPRSYGGTELIVAELVRGFAAAGHEVTLFATRDSRPPSGVDLRALFARGIWPPRPEVERDHAAWAIEQLLCDRRGFDVVHTHVPAALRFAPLVEAPLVCSVHHDDGDDYARLRRTYERARAQLVAISERQRQRMPALAGARVIHHGLDPTRYRDGDGYGGYCAFLGRFARDKGVHHAIDAARAAGVPIRLGGRPHWHDGDYFERDVVPRLALPNVTCVGEVDGEAKRELLAGARALLFPVGWEEPFGLVMIEAMLSGTPVLAFARGSVPEVVDEGVTGFVCRDVGEMAARLRTLDDFDRAACRRRALARWSSARMVDDHLALYDELQWRSDGRTAQTLA
jgi:glycosyltransferase involved in cell wall biosynthesis